MRKQPVIFTIKVPANVNSDKTYFAEKKDVQKQTMIPMPQQKKSNNKI